MATRLATRRRPADHRRRCSLYGAACVVGRTGPVERMRRLYLLRRSDRRRGSATGDARPAAGRLSAVTGNACRDGALRLLERPADSLQRIVRTGLRRGLRDGNHRHGAVADFRRSVVPPGAAPRSTPGFAGDCRSEPRLLTPATGRDGGRPGGAKSPVAARRRRPGAIDIRHAGAVSDDVRRAAAAADRGDAYLPAAVCILGGEVRRRPGARDAPGAADSARVAAPATEMPQPDALLPGGSRSPAGRSPTRGRR